MARFYDPVRYETSGSLAAGSWQFNRKKGGTRKRCDHPILMGEETEKQDIYGYCGNLYCPNCGGKFDFILLEFEKPSADSFSLWTLEQIDQDIMKCPKCGYRDLESVS